jgi:hypothetical protein
MQQGCQTFGSPKWRKTKADGGPDAFENANRLDAMSLSRQCESDHLRGLHGERSASMSSAEWQYYISGKGRMGLVLPHGARTMDFNANDVGFVPRVAGHYIENTDDTDLQVLKMFATGDFQEIFLNNWIRRIPPEMATAHLNLDADALSKSPAARGSTCSRGNLMADSAHQKAGLSGTRENC